MSIAPLVPVIRNISRQAELHWLETHRLEFSGQWVALNGDQLGVDALAVHDEARQKGVANPLLVHVPPNEDKFSVGWP